MAPKQELPPTLRFGNRLPLPRRVRFGGHRSFRPLASGFPWLGIVCIVVAALATSVTAAGAQPAARLESPNPAEIVRGPLAIRDTVLTRPALEHLQKAGTAWGGPYTTPTGETVTVYASDAYPQDPALGQRWANFLDGLVHGTELSLLTVYLAPLAEVQSVCGQQAIGCYSPGDNTLVAPGDDPSTDTSAEAVITHEYGHHVANHRSDAPWDALDYGTKRWATYEQVCAKTAAGQLFPGAETEPRYMLNPGEAFAEIYRVLNERLAGLTEAPWDVVSQSLYPDNVALSLLQQDVVSPWTTNTMQTRTASFAKQGTATRSFTFSTPLDGTLKVSLSHARGLGTALAVSKGGTRAAASSTVCGTRSVRVTVTRKSGSGSFKLSASTA